MEGYCHPEYYDIAFAVDDPGRNDFDLAAPVTPQGRHTAILRRLP